MVRRFLGVAGAGTACLLLSATVCSAQDPIEAAQAGIDWLLPAVCDWTEPDGASQFMDCAEESSDDQCFGCHVQAESVLGLARSTDRCYALPEHPCRDAGDADALEFAMRFMERVQRKECILGPYTCPGTPEDPTTRDGYPPDLGSIGSIPECGSNFLPGTDSAAPLTTSVHGGLTFAGYTRHMGAGYVDAYLDLTDWLVGRQEADGRWILDRVPEEPPVDQGDAFATGAAVLTLSGVLPHAGAAQASSYEAAIESAASWMRTAPRSTTQDKLYAILALREAGFSTSDPDVTALREDLHNDQLADGGWAERVGLDSNPYATGQALVGLLEGGASLDDPVLCDGIDWLLARQEAAGNWQIGEAGVNTDSTRNSDFTATVWPVLALSSLERFGAAFVPETLELEGCADEAVFELELVNDADNPCGRFPRSDELVVEAAVQGGGDVLWTPERATLDAGDRVPLEVIWRRPGEPLVPGETVTIALEARSSASEAAGCPRESLGEIVLRGSEDPVPGPLEFTFRVGKEEDDLLFSWQGHGQPVGAYQVVRHDCPERTVCPTTPPTRDVLDAKTPVLDEPPASRGARQGGDAAHGTPELRFYKVRATSPCRGLAGPTCNFGCTDPARCHKGCP